MNLHSVSFSNDDSLLTISTRCNEISPHNRPNDALNKEPTNKRATRHNNAVFFYFFSFHFFRDKQSICVVKFEQILNKFNIHTDWFDW